MKDDLLLIAGDARHIPLGDGAVQCIVTSPPYWGLRKYAGEQELVWLPARRRRRAAQCEHEWADADRPAADYSKQRWQNANNGQQLASGEARAVTEEDRRQNANSIAAAAACTKCGAWRGAYGLEPTIEMYVAHSVEILRECRRVLRPDGVLFWNLGDSYHNGDKGGYRAGRLGLRSELQKSNMAANIPGAPNRNPQAGLKPKDLCLMPARVALAAQADVSVRNGVKQSWWVRSVIVWAKPNPMPESVTDRPTDAYEHILMLTKSERYFWDADAVREPSTGNTHSRGDGDGGPKAAERGTHEGWPDGTRAVLADRNLRNVWTFPTQPYAGAHFATFPEEIPRRCILAATSARGACVQCGAPWQRVTRTIRTLESGSGQSGIRPNGKGAGGDQVREDHDVRLGPCVESQTMGWQPSCRCRSQRGRTMPCLVLDPFGGSGTTGRVALSLRRRAVLLDLAYSAEYADLARERTRNIQLEAFL